MTAERFSLTFNELCRGTGGSLQRGFFRSMLSHGDLYRRAVGFFSSSVFRAAWPEFLEFFRQGRIELVCSNRLSPEDAKAILAGLTQPIKWTSATVDDLRSCSGMSSTDLLSWAVATHRLAIRIATVLASPDFLYHEKFGIMLSQGAITLGFEGSANESHAALRENYERVRLFSPSSAAGRHQALLLLAEFESLWHNGTPGLDVVPVADALRRGIIAFHDRRDEFKCDGEHRPTTHPDAMEIPEEIPRLPDRLTLRSYQSNAVRKWLQSGGRGVLEMATGAGKTITALSAATQLAEGLRQPLVLVIVVPYLHLVDQWNDEARKFGLSPVVCSGSQSSWVRFAEAVVLRANAGHRRFTSLIATNATFCGDSFQKVLRSIRALTMLVADEVHNLGAPKLAKSLPEHAQLRMGLSATPTRWLDPDGTDRLTRYFGPTAFRFDLRDALRADPPVLVPYRYHPILVDLDQSEQEQYIELTTAIGRLIGSDDDSPLSDMAKALLIKRSRLIACARNKLPRLRQTIAPFASSIHNLIYCGDGSFDFADDGNDRSSEPTVLRQIDAVTMMLGRDLHMSVAQFTSDTPTAERREILQRFGAGELQALVAIRCLDEGVDVPAITRAFILASSSNPRQFVQRRGRILRRASGKSLAEIYDFVVRPPECFMGDQSGFTGARALIRREMSRVAEFAGLADNGPEARSILLPVLRAWDLLHL